VAAGYRIMSPGSGQMPRYVSGDGPRRAHAGKEQYAEMKDYNIGSQLKSLRKAKRMTLQFVAGETGMSAPLLSQIENGNVTPSLRTLAKLASYFQVRMSRLFEGINNKPKYEIFRHIDRSQETLHDYVLKKKRNYCYSLLPADSKKRMNCSVFDLRSDGSIDATATKNGETFLYVIAGKVEISKNDERYTVEAGDSVYLDSSIVIGVKPIDCLRAKVMRVETE
jgi:transcriptional regulator with XRE-family HTH domain